MLHFPYANRLFKPWPKRAGPNYLIPFPPEEPNVFKNLQIYRLPTPWEIDLRVGRESCEILGKTA